MKKIASLLMAALMLVSMLTVFAVPASAETKTADEYMSDAAQHESNERYSEAADAYANAARRYKGARNYASAADAYNKAGECFEKNNNLFEAGDAFCNAAEQYRSAGNYASATNIYKKAGDTYMKDEFYGDADPFTQAGNSYEKAGDYVGVANAYMKAGECCLKTDRFSEAADWLSIAAEAARRKANESTGSTLSEGSLTIICTIAVAVIFGLGGFFIGKAAEKKKKPALASGTDNTDEE